MAQKQTKNSLLQAKKLKTKFVETLQENPAITHNVL